jgi:hypothetical protein
MNENEDNGKLLLSRSKYKKKLLLPITKKELMKATSFRLFGNKRNKKMSQRNGIEWEKKNFTN